MPHHSLSTTERVVYVLGALAGFAVRGLAPGGYSMMVLGFAAMCALVAGLLGIRYQVRPRPA